MMFKIRVYSHCLPREGNDLFQEISFDTELPYIPLVGGSISASPCHDIAKIEDVIYIPYQTDEHERICVYCEFPDALDEFDRFVAEGWVSA